MARLRQLFNQLLRDDDGPTAIEYAVLLAMIFLVCIGAVNSVGNAVSQSLQKTADDISTTAGGSGSSSSGAGSSGSAGSGNGKGNNGNGKGGGKGKGNGS